MIVSLTLFQSPPPSIVVVTKNPDQRLKATVSLATAWPTGTGLAWFEGGRVLTDRWSNRLSLVIPDSSLENKKVIAELRRMGTARVPFSVSAGVPGLGGGTSARGTGAGASGTGSGGGTRPAVQGTPPKVAVDSATLRQLEKDGVLSAAQSAAFGKGLAAAAGLTDAQRQELLGVLVGNAASHEPPDTALTQTELTQLFDFIRASPKLLKDLPETAPPIERELRIKEITRLLDSLGATQAKPPDPNAFGSSGSGTGGGGLSAADRLLLQDYKAKYGKPWDVEAPGAAEPLTSTHKFRIALRLSLRWMPAGAGAELEAMLHSAWFWAGVAVGIGAYVALWLVPEPVISKSVAAGITIALLSLYGVSEIIAVAKAWTALSDDCDHAISLADLELAAEKFGRAAGAVGARILVTLATILIGGKVLPKRLPPPPGAPIAVQQVLWGAAGRGAALSTVPTLVVDWQAAAAQSAWAIKVLTDGSVVIVSAGSTVMMASSRGPSGPLAPAAKGRARPTGPDGGTPTGTPETSSPGDNAETIRSHEAERKAAEVLANRGYPTEHQPRVTYGKKPDLKVSGYIFDVYAPGKGKQLDGVWDAIAKKVGDGQTRRVVVFLDDWILGAGASRMTITNHVKKAAQHTPGVEQILLVLKGKVYDIHP